jgi:AMMECR1 domain-containing protein
LPEFKNLESSFLGYKSSCEYEFFKNHDYSNRLFIQKNMENIRTYASFIFQKNSCYKNSIGWYEQSQLLQQARLGLEGAFEFSAQRRLPCMISYEMTQPHGVFTSVYTMSDHGIVLRGCMGKVESQVPLFDMVYQMSEQAARKDLRFYPICQKDIANTIISLAVVVDLKDVMKCDEIDEWDGVLLKYNDKLAVVLPCKSSKIRTPGWNYDAMLSDLSSQIQLDSFLWKNPYSKIFTFGTFDFQEE